MAREEHRKEDGPRLWAKVFVPYSIANEDSPETFKTGEQYNHFFFFSRDIESRVVTEGSDDQDQAVANTVICFCSVIWLFLSF